LLECWAFEAAIGANDSVISAKSTAISTSDSVISAKSTAIGANGAEIGPKSTAISTSDSVISAKCTVIGAKPALNTAQSALNITQSRLYRRITKRPCPMPLMLMR
jgi:hypothetical protein